MDDEPSERVIRVTRDEGEADAWDLVLTAEAIPHRLETGEWGWAFVVPAGQAERAATTLDGYAREVRERQVEERAELAEPRPTWSQAGLVVGALLAVAFMATGETGRFVEAGVAVSERILAGEWWRAVTALTLHADPGHVFGNAACAALFLGAAGRRLGFGLGVLVVLAAGVLGNVMNALVHGPGHASLGASTALFGAVGVLAAAGAVDRWRDAVRRGRRDARRDDARRPGRLLSREGLRRRAWIPLGAALGLFAMLGTGGRQTDVLAHLAGLLAGLLLGVPAALAARRAPGLLAQIAFALAAAALVAAAWALALR